MWTDQEDSGPLFGTSVPLHWSETRKLWTSFWIEPCYIHIIAKFKCSAGLGSPQSCFWAQCLELSSYQSETRNTVTFQRLWDYYSDFNDNNNNNPYFPPTQGEESCMVLVWRHTWCRTATKTQQNTGDSESYQTPINLNSRHAFNMFITRTTKCCKTKHPINQQHFH